MLKYILQILHALLIVALATNASSNRKEDVRESWFTEFLSGRLYNIPEQVLNLQDDSVQTLLLKAALLYKKNRFNLSRENIILALSKDNATFIERKLSISLLKNMYLLDREKQVFLTMINDSRNLEAVRENSHESDFNTLIDLKTELENGLLPTIKFGKAKPISFDAAPRESLHGKGDSLNARHPIPGYFFQIRFRDKNNILHYCSVDTGSQNSYFPIDILSPEGNKQVEKSNLPFVVNVGVGENRPDIQVIRNNQLTVGNIQYLQYPFTITKLKEIDIDNQNCLIGLPTLLKAKKVLFNGQKNYMEFGGTALAGSAFKTVSLSVSSEGLLLADTSYRADYMPVIVDTGASITGLNRFFHSRKNEELDEVFYYGNPVSFYVLKDFVLTLGKSDFKTPYTWVDFTNYLGNTIYPESNFQHYGLIGMDILGQFQWIGFDFTKMEMYLGPLREDSYTYKQQALSE
jgi:hypothetical protein